MNSQTRQHGFALVSVILVTTLLMALVSGYFILTDIDMTSTGSSMDSMRGFYAAEGGINLRAAGVRSLFVGYNVPTGVSPDVTSNPCYGSNLGSGDFACQTVSMQDRGVNTYLVEAPGNPMSIVIPRGEQFQNLNASEYVYHVNSHAQAAGATEAQLEMDLRTRLVPMFQFAAFYNKDLEILPGPDMDLEGPVHANGDLYVDAGSSLDISGQVTTAGDLYRGRKNSDTCTGGGVTVPDPATPTEIPACSGSQRTQMAQPDLDAWNGMIRTQTDVLEVPPPDAFDPVPGNEYWDLADLRVVLDLGGGSPGVVQVRSADGTVDNPRTAALNGCAGAAGTTSGVFYDNREGTAIEMLEIDVDEVLDCIQNQVVLGAIDDISQGGLVWHLSVDGPDSATINNYGVRLKDGSKLASDVPGAPDIQGLTVVTDQAVYIQGDYNAISKKPAAVMADSLNILSNNWDDTNSTLDLSSRTATPTTINAAFLAGTDLTGGADGVAGQDSGSYNGGLENYPRFHESWSGQPLTYRGSFVSLGVPRRSDGAWVYGNPVYQAPIRDWRYDTDFNNMANLPPMSPRFVYLKQELFVRRFDL